MKPRFRPNPRLYNPIYEGGKSITPPLRYNEDLDDYPYKGSMNPYKWRGVERQQGIDGASKQRMSYVNIYTIFLLLTAVVAVVVVCLTSGLLVGMFGSSK